MNKQQEPIKAEIVAIKLTREEFEQLKQKGYTTKADSRGEIELPQGPMRIGSQWWWFNHAE